MGRAAAQAFADVIDGKAAIDLAKARAIEGATVFGRPGGWNVLVRYAGGERAVAARRARTPRLWRNLSTAADFVREELGLGRFDVDAEGHSQDSLRRRPDQSARMKSRHEAAAHDSWFRAEVETRTLEADGSDARWVSHERVMDDLAARIARLDARRS
ncbi:hypothetical protein [Enterovirga rhinocerotis]|uniref:Uncharacterized protein n=1 Tax=Enterovirga rhinocerotis TaxID=1339210 RepID=A0A4R7BVA6_9HYPH|nr:hypothetical protein [Enterovirga rhinocerotis]TDR89760.1 hypothetical protein EV668_2595 [Enterovirga rhinocerotis]